MYGKIFSDIFDSSIMVHGGDTVYVFIALIVLADPKGHSRITAPALANRIGKPLDIVEEALRRLEAPDIGSTTPSEDGKRIIPLKDLTGGEENRGWWIVNYELYRIRRDRETQRLQTKERVRKHRKADKADNVTLGNANVTLGNASKQQGEGEGEEEGKRKNGAKRATSVPQEFLLTEDLKTWAKEQGLSFGTLEKETPRFLDYHRAKGTTFKNWGAAWKNWMRNVKEWAKDKGDKSISSMMEGAL